MYTDDMKKKEKLISKYEKWELLEEGKKSRASRMGRKEELGNRNDEIIKVLLKNRGIVTKKSVNEFFNPIHPDKIRLEETGIDGKSLKIGIKRIEKALKNKEKVVIFGDYDCDGITSSAILWEYLYGIGMDVTPYIPERFSEGYGIKPESIIKLKNLYPTLSLIITVDNGIIAFEAVADAGELGIDTIILDHHEKGEKYPQAHSIIHTTKLCGAGIAWFFVRELSKSIKYQVSSIKSDYCGLELAALGTIADQMPLIGINRSIVKYGLECLNQTSRPGLIALSEVSGIEKGNIGIYEVNYVIAPRLNAMGRMENAIDSLRLLCTKSRSRANELAALLDRTNTKRQKIVEVVVGKAKILMDKGKLGKIIILEDESFHEGVIGLAASKLVEEFSRPAIVIAKGNMISKASARSIPGLNIIETIRVASKLLISGGGHEMAAGFSIKNSDLKEFKKSLFKYCDKKVSSKLLEKKLKIDLEVNFEPLSNSLFEKIKQMEPFGIGNPGPTFLTRECEILESKKVGKSGNHLKFNIKKGGITFDAISFNNPNESDFIRTGAILDIAYNLDENYWNGTTSLQLKIKDLK